MAETNNSNSNHLKKLTILKYNNIRLTPEKEYDIFKENKIYIKGEFRESLGMNFVSPFKPEREFKVYKSCKCSQIICSRVR